MRHGHGLKKLNRTTAHRQALFKNLSQALLREEVIRTTLPKAKALRKVVEPLITLGKTASLSNRRLAASRIQDDAVVKKLFSNIGPRFAKRQGGYTRILKCGYRVGDNAPMAFIELLDRPVTAKAVEESEE